MTETGSDSALEPSAPSERKVSWAELFFDLVFVVAITKMSTVVEADHSWAGLLRALIVFIPIYWLWVATSIQANLFDLSGAVGRLRIFVVALAGVFLALALPGAYGDDAEVFAAAYWAGRVVLGVPLVHRVGGRISIPVNGYSVSMLVTGPLLVVGALLDGDARDSLATAEAQLQVARLVGPARRLPCPAERRRMRPHRSCQQADAYSRPDDRWVSITRLHRLLIAGAGAGGRVDAPASRTDSRRSAAGSRQPSLRSDRADFCLQRHLSAARSVRGRS